MRGKRACIVVDLRAGQHVARIPDLVAVLAAADWKTDIALKAYGGETLKLAQKAAKDGYDLVVGYGGDGTLNAVLNGIMYAGEKSLAAVIPGGTYNVWAGAMGLSDDPVKAALALVNSEARKVDLGHMEVEGLMFPHGAEHNQQPASNGKTQKKPKRSSRVRQHFLLNVGLGLDAAMIAHISKPLKYHVGPLAFDLAAVKELPKQRPFPVEARVIDEAGTVYTQWQGEVWQVYVSKVPLFGGAINIEPDARADDGLLHVCLVTANDLVKTMEQALSVLTQHKLDKETTKYFRGKHFSIRVPASIGMHVDGSTMKLAELLHKSERNALQQMSDTSEVIVDYRFDAEPGALQMAIPRTYDGPLFVQMPHREDSQAPSQQRADGQGSTRQHAVAQGSETSLDNQKRVQALQASGYRATVVGVAPNQGQQHSYIVAGSHKKENTDETEIVAVRIDDQTLLLNSEGARVSPTTVMELQEGNEIVVEGEKSKRGVIRASTVVL